MGGGDVAVAAHFEDQEAGVGLEGGVEGGEGGGAGLGVAQDPVEGGVGDSVPEGDGGEFLDGGGWDGERGRGDGLGMRERLGLGCAVAAYILSHWPLMMSGSRSRCLQSTTLKVTFGEP